MSAYARAPHQGVIVRNFDRPDTDAIKSLNEAYTGMILDHLGKQGALAHPIRPIARHMSVCGPATTTLGPDLGMRRAAIDLAEPGDVLVVAAGGAAEFACFGDGTATRMQLKKLAGAVVDGGVRDVAGIRALGFPTFCRSVTPRNFFYPADGAYGAVNVPVVVGGQMVHPGDLICGDADGVVVVPRSLVNSVAAAVAAQLRIERAERASWEEYPPYGIEGQLRDRGYKFVDKLSDLDT